MAVDLLAEVHDMHLDGDASNLSRRVVRVGASANFAFAGRGWRAFDVAHVGHVAMLARGISVYEESGGDAAKWTKSC